MLQTFEETRRVATVVHITVSHYILAGAGGGDMFQ